MREAISEMECETKETKATRRFSTFSGRPAPRSPPRLQQLYRAGPLNHTANNHWFMMLQQQHEVVFALLLSLD